MPIKRLNSDWHSKVCYHPSIKPSGALQSFSGQRTSVTVTKISQASSSALCFNKPLHYDFALSSRATPERLNHGKMEPLTGIGTGNSFGLIHRTTNIALNAPFREPLGFSRNAFYIKLERQNGAKCRCCPDFNKFTKLGGLLNHKAEIGGLGGTCTHNLSGKNRLL